MHLTLGNMLRMTELTGPNWVDKIDKIIQEISWALQSTVNTVTKYTPEEIIVGRNMILPIAIRLDF